MITETAYMSELINNYKYGNFMVIFWVLVLVQFFLVINVSIEIILEFGEKLFKKLMKSMMSHINMYLKRMLKLHSQSRQLIECEDFVNASLYFL